MKETSLKPTEISLYGSPLLVTVRSLAQCNGLWFASTFIQRGSGWKSPLAILDASKNTWISTSDTDLWAGVVQHLVSYISSTSAVAPSPSPSPLATLKSHSRPTMSGWDWALIILSVFATMVIVAVISFLMLKTYKKRKAEEVEFI